MHAVGSSSLDVFTHLGPSKPCCFGHCVHFMVTVSTRFCMWLLVSDGTHLFHWGQNSRSPRCNNCGNHGTAQQISASVHPWEREEGSQAALAAGWCLECAAAQQTALQFGLR